MINSPMYQNAQLPSGFGQFGEMAGRHNCRSCRCQGATSAGAATWRQIRKCCRMKKRAGVTQR